MRKKHWFLKLNFNPFFAASEVSRLSGVDVTTEVFNALEMNAYCVTAAVDYLLNVMSFCHTRPELTNSTELIVSLWPRVVLISLDAQCETKTV